MELISRHYDDPLAGHFEIDKTRELIARKYYRPSLRTDVDAYVKACDVCLACKVVRHKPYRDLQLLPVPTHRWKDLSIDFVTGLPVSTNWKGETYDPIPVIVDRLTKMVHYKLVKFTIHTPDLAKVIINVIVRHHCLLDSIFCDRGWVFTSKFWLSLFYFLRIKKKLSTAFYTQTDGQTEMKNSTIEAHLRAFVNYEHYDRARLLPMAKFSYNNAKKTIISHKPFELNRGFHPQASYEEDVDLLSKWKAADELATKLMELTTVCRENLQYTQKLQKRYHNKHAKPRRYAPGEKVWLNSKYIKTKQNRKLEAKFFGPFRVLHPVGKQAYKLELPKRWRIHDVFHVSLLEQDTTRKGRVDEATSQLEFEGDGGDGEEYEVEAIRDSAVYARESEGHLPGLYYLVSWKGYPEEENTWEPASAIQHLRRLVSTFHKEHPEKPTATSPPTDSAPPRARPTVKPTGKPFPEPSAAKRKRGRPAKASGANKQAKKSWTFDFCFGFGCRWSSDHLQLFPRSTFSIPLLFGFFFLSLQLGQKVFSTNALTYSRLASSQRTARRLSKTFRFFLHQVPRRFGDFFHRSALQVFLHHFPLRFWRFFLPKLQPHLQLSLQLPTSTHLSEIPS